MEKKSTITGIATPKGNSALAILRISGPEAFTLIEKCIREKEKFKTKKAWKISRYTFINPKDKKAIDDITAIKYECPRSYTGENMVEIMCHGGVVVTEKIMGALLEIGMEIAQRGEFTRRAYLQGKMDLMKAESIKAIIDCDSEIGFERAQKAYKGKYKEKIEKWHHMLIELLANIEAQIEFGEEESVAESNDEYVTPIDYLKREIEEEIRRNKKIQKIEHGWKIAIMGPVNAGKSTLFNYLVGYERSIVTNTPGTTRDTITESIRVKGNEITIIDSAGLRVTTNEIEQEGMKRAEHEGKKANGIIWVTSAGEPIKEIEMEWIERIKKCDHLLIINKIDKEQDEEKMGFCERNKIKHISVSLKEKTNTEKMIEEIEQQFYKNITKEDIPDVISTKRQEGIGERIVEELGNAKTRIGEIEIMAFHVRNAIRALEEFVGYTTNEDVMNRVFETFCIGK